ncbi:MAG: beta-propeller fold lactonase family protein, partial [Chthoniobacterales bacterium]|nr:beta-propeller fold lactonase family protein [Chthoniobacterales bacterium]
MKTNSTTRKPSKDVFSRLRRKAFLCFAILGMAQAAYSQAPDPANTDATAASTGGAVFALTNRAKNNEVVAFRRAADGTLTQTGRYSTGGSGIGVDFDTQGGLTLHNNHRFLYACNPGSDNVSVFAVDGSRLTMLQRVYAGDQPLSITFSGNLAYVLDGSVAGNGITGFTVGNDGRLTPIPDSFRALSSPIAVPGEVQFSPDG